MAAVAISNIMYTALHSFYPIYIETNFPGLTSMHFSIIIAIFEVSNLTTSLVLGLYMGKLKRKNLVIGSNVLLLLSTISFVFLPMLSASEKLPALDLPLMNN
jgi:sugar phosphate permease